METGRSSAVRLLTRILFPIKEGSLWWGREDLLKDATGTPGKTYPGSDRDGHPLVFIFEIEPEQLFHPIPGLIGFSHTHPCAFTASGLSRELGSDYQTEFSPKYRPLIPFAELYSPAPDADPNHLTGKWHERSRLSRNHHKPELDADELEELRAWKSLVQKLR